MRRFKKCRLENILDINKPLIMYGVECVLHTILEIRALLPRVIVDSNTSIFD